jgi:hypothetical protein
MKNKTVIAGGAVLLLAGILFIVFSSNDDIAQVIQSVESEVAEQMEERSLSVGKGEDEPTDEEKTTLDPEAVKAVPQPAPVNTVILGEVSGGNVITVPQATLLKPGFVVLYRINSKGESTLVGDSQLLTAGTHRDITIRLSSLAVETQALVAVLHEDDGNGTFEQGSDGYLLNGSLLVSDIDVVGIKRSDREGRILETKIEAFLETNFRN